MVVSELTIPPPAERVRLGAGPRDAASHERALRLGCGLAYAVEFVELGLGDALEQRSHEGETNAAGLHGAGILSPFELLAPRVVRLERSGRWFDGTLGERRIGGRIAVLARVATPGRPITFASVHLESHGDPDERATQLETLLDAIDAYAPGDALDPAGRPLSDHELLALRCHVGRSGGAV